MQIPFAIEGRLPTDSGGVSDQETLTTNYSLVTPNFFSTMRIPMRRGRDFSSRDTADGVWVAIINEAMARRFWPHDDPIGKRLTATIVPDEQPREIIGVVGDMALSRWERVRSPMLYVSHLQQPLHYRAPYGQDRVQMTFVLRTLQRPEAVIPALRRAVSDVDSSAPVAHVQTIEQHLARQVDAPRYYLVLLGIFGAVAMTLATSGIYGVIAYSVAERRREIAIRVAFGADARRVVTLVLREGVLLTAVGLMLGLAGAVALTRFLAAVLWEVTPTDPGTFIGVALFLAAIALLASLMPARRALRLDPMVVLGSE